MVSDLGYQVLGHGERTIVSPLVLDGSGSDITTEAFPRYQDPNIPPNGRNSFGGYSNISRGQQVPHEEHTLDMIDYNKIESILPSPNDWVKISFSEPAEHILISHNALLRVYVPPKSITRQGHLSQIYPVVISTTNFTARVAVKHFRPLHRDPQYHALESDAYLHRLEQEERCFRTLAHQSPYIVRVYRILKEPQPGLVMPFFPYSLNDILAHIRRRPSVYPTPLDVSKKLLHDLSHGVAEIQTHGIIHRNITGSTVLVRLNSRHESHGFDLHNLDFVIGSFEFSVFQKDLKKMGLHDAGALLCAPVDAQPPEVKPFFDHGFVLSETNLHQVIRPICTLIDSYQVGRCALAALVNWEPDPFNKADIALSPHAKDGMRELIHKYPTHLGLLENLTRSRATHQQEQDRASCASFLRSIQAL